MSVQMSQTFAVALRAELVECVRRDAVPSRRRWWKAAAFTVATLVAAGSGVAIADQFGTTPGSNVVTPLAATVTVSASGTQTVELGKAPAGANHIDIKLTCLTAGRFVVADGASLVCTEGHPGRDDTAGTILYGLPLAPRQHTTTITAASGARWRLEATFSKVTTTAWGINANGQTYGVANANGTPDLVAAVATNGKDGYIYASQLQQPNYTSPAQALAAQKHHHSGALRVYELDGKTVIGTFVLQ